MPYWPARASIVCSQWFGSETVLGLDDIDHTLIFKFFLGQVD